MNKTRIVLASVLKPINDTRMFEKLGLSLAKLPTTEIHVVGFQAPLPVATAIIFFHPIFRFKRLGLGRILASFRFYKLLWQLAPQIIIISTHELLLAGLFYKLFRSCRLVYDVRENYYLNLTSQKVYPRLISYLLAFIIRFTEYLAAPFITCFFLAEKSYATELTFIRQKYLVLENKYKPETTETIYTPPTAGKKLSSDQINMLYSGTISEIYGIFRAINLCKALNQIAPIFKLTIIGYCPQPSVLVKIKNEIKNYPFITLIGGDYLIPHAQIVAAIQKSHLGLLPYQPHISTFSCIPTKLFEYLGHALPVIAQQNPLWHELIQQHEAGVSINYNNFQAEDLYQNICNRTFYRNANVATVLWEAEEKKLLAWARTTIL